MTSKWISEPTMPGYYWYWSTTDCLICIVLADLRFGDIHALEYWICGDDRPLKPQADAKWLKLPDMITLS